ncbi:hypothetical protein ACFX13_007876 [Malus domestica]|uniref:transcription factor GTE4-like isoform X1 n=1 Tax=Malus sylvestris TaxID=3752 RepID=UPI0021AC21EC|nr:transcription factor GTE4-like isoform X1 [Malus sylvestris]XP_050111296.1 transcription factor GTE4-like isoform X1 [Malus sylvestris]XP_050111297.1 transcription factor GTE4-like isoform X1 [Malus sylvestris]
MVSGPLVGDEASNKAYSRTTQNKSKNPNHVLHHSSPPPQDLTQLRGALASNDSTSHNGLLPGFAEPVDGPRGYAKFGNMVRIRLGSQSKDDRRQIKGKLTGELEQVRCLMKNLEAKEIELGERYGQSLSSNHAVDNVKPTMRANLEAGSVGLRDSGKYRGLSVSVAENKNGVGQFVEKENVKKRPKTNQRSEFLIGKEKLPPSESSKKLKPTQGGRDGGGGEPWFRSGKNRSKMFQNCSALLEKLMKHKFGWVFNKPVDVKMLGLHDYNTIVKKPMDLGTVRTRLNENWYKTPAEFAEDVRLTFNNAMLYNPKEQDAHLMADQLLKLFEVKWTDVEAEYNLNLRNELGNNSNFTTPVSRKDEAPAPPPPLASNMRTLDRAESITKPVDHKLKPVSSGHPGRVSVPKKPKARDPDKRDMSYEEKQRLSADLMTLPSEKLDNVVKIIRKRNPGPFQQEDEIEVDIGSVDPETLWELDRFVTNYKKSLSKVNRNVELGSQSIAEPCDTIQEMTVAPATTMAAKEANAEVENNSNAFSPVRIEEQGDNVSGSSSSSSESESSSSDSDNESSCGVESDSNH